jgi:hypothetical protein
MCAKPSTNGRGLSFLQPFNKKTNKCDERLRQIQNSSLILRYDKIKEIKHIISV